MRNPPRPRPPGSPGALAPDLMHVSPSRTILPLQDRLDAYALIEYEAPEDDLDSARPNFILDELRSLVGRDGADGGLLRVPGSAEDEEDFARLLAAEQMGKKTSKGASMGSVSTVLARRHHARWVRRWWMQWREGYAASRFSRAKWQLGSSLFSTRVLKKAVRGWVHVAHEVPSVQLAFVELKNLEKKYAFARDALWDWHCAARSKRHLWKGRTSTRQDGSGATYTEKLNFCVRASPGNVFRFWHAFVQKQRRMDECTEVLRFEKCKARIRSWHLSFCHAQVFAFRRASTKKYWLRVWHKEIVVDRAKIKRVQERWAYFNVFSLFLELTYKQLDSKRSRAATHFDKRTLRICLPEWLQAAKVAQQTRKFSEIAKVFSGASAIRAAWAQWIAYHKHCRILKRKFQAADAHSRSKQFATVVRAATQAWRQTVRMVRAARGNSFLLGEKRDETRLENTFGMWCGHVEDVKYERGLLKIMRRIEMQHFAAPALEYWKQWLAEEKVAKKFALLAAEFSGEMKLRMSFKSWSEWAFTTKKERVWKEMWSNFALRHGYGKRAFYDWRENIASKAQIERFARLFASSSRTTALQLHFMEWKDYTDAQLTDKRFQEISREYERRCVYKKFFLRFCQAVAHLQKVRNLCGTLMSSFGDGAKKRYFQEWHKFLSGVKRERANAEKLELLLKKNFEHKFFAHWKSSFTVRNTLKIKKEEFLDGPHRVLTLMRLLREWSESRELSENHRHKYEKAGSFRLEWWGFRPWRKAVADARRLRFCAQFLAENNKGYVQLSAFQNWQYFCKSQYRDRENDKKVNTAYRLPTLRGVFRGWRFFLQSEKQYREKMAYLHELAGLHVYSVALQRHFSAWSGFAQEEKRERRNSVACLQHLIFTAVRRCYSAWMEYMLESRRRRMNGDKAEVLLQQRVLRKWRRNAMVRGKLRKINIAILQRSTVGLVRLGWTGLCQYWQRGRSIRYTGKSLLGRLYYATRRGIFDAWIAFVEIEHTLQHCGGVLSEKNALLRKKRAWRAWLDELAYQRPRKKRREAKLRMFRNEKRLRLMHHWLKLMIVQRWKCDNQARSLALRPFGAWVRLTKRHKRERLAAAKVVAKRKLAILRPWIALMKEQIRDKVRERKKDRWRLKHVFLAFCRGCSREGHLNLYVPFLLWKRICVIRAHTRHTVAEIFGAFVQRWKLKKPRREKDRYGRWRNAMRTKRKCIREWHERVFFSAKRKQLVQRSTLFHLCLLVKRKELWRLGKLAGFLKTQTWRFFHAWRAIFERTRENMRVIALKRRIRQRDNESRPSFYFNVTEYALAQWKRHFLARRQFRIRYGTRVLGLWSSVALKDPERVQLLNRRRKVRDYSYLFSYSRLVQGDGLFPTTTNLAMMNTSSISHNSSNLVAGNSSYPTGVSCTSPTPKKASIAPRREGGMRHWWAASGDTIKCGGVHLSVVTPTAGAAGGTRGGWPSSASNVFGTVSSRAKIRSKSTDGGFDPTMSKLSSKLSTDSKKPPFFVVPTKSTHALGGAFSDSCYNRALNETHLVAEWRKRRGKSCGPSSGTANSRSRASTARGRTLSFRNPLASRVVVLSSADDAPSPTLESAIGGDVFFSAQSCGGASASNMRPPFAPASRRSSVSVVNPNSYATAASTAPRMSATLTPPLVSEPNSPPRRPPAEHPPPSAHKSDNKLEQALFGRARAAQPVGVSYSARCSASALGGGRVQSGGSSSSSSLFKRAEEYLRVEDDVEAAEPSLEEREHAAKTTKSLRESSGSILVDYFRYGSSERDNSEVLSASRVPKEQRPPSRPNDEKPTSGSVSPAARSVRSFERADPHVIMQYGCDWFVDRPAKRSAEDAGLPRTSYGLSAAGSNGAEDREATGQERSEGPISEASPNKRRRRSNDESSAPTTNAHAVAGWKNIVEATSVAPAKKGAAERTAPVPSSSRAAPRARGHFRNSIQELSPRKVFTDELESRKSSKARSIRLAQDDSAKDSELGENVTLAPSSSRAARSTSEKRNPFEPTPRENARNLDEYINGSSEFTLQPGPEAASAAQVSLERAPLRPSEGEHLQNNHVESVELLCSLDTSTIRSESRDNVRASKESAVSSVFGPSSAASEAKILPLTASKASGKSREDAKDSPESSRKRVVLNVHAKQEERSTAATSAIFPNAKTSVKVGTSSATSSTNLLPPAAGDGVGALSGGSLAPNKPESRIDRLAREIQNLEARTLQASPPGLEISLDRTCERIWYGPRKYGEELAKKDAPVPYLLRSTLFGDGQADPAEKPPGSPVSASASRVEVEDQPTPSRKADPWAVFPAAVEAAKRGLNSPTRQRSSLKIEQPKRPELSSRLGVESLARSSASARSLSSAADRGHPASANPSVGERDSEKAAGGSSSPSNRPGVRTFAVPQPAHQILESKLAPGTSLPERLQSPRNRPLPSVSWGSVSGKTISPSQSPETDDVRGEEGAAPEPATEAVNGGANNNKNPTLFYTAPDERSEHLGHHDLMSSASLIVKNHDYDTAVDDAASGDSIAASMIRMKTLEEEIGPPITPVEEAATPESDRQIVVIHSSSSSQLAAEPLRLHPPLHISEPSPPSTSQNNFSLLRRDDEIGMKNVPAPPSKTEQESAFGVSSDAASAAGTQYFEPKKVVLVMASNPGSARKASSGAPGAADGRNGSASPTTSITAANIRVQLPAEPFKAAAGPTQTKARKMTIAHPRIRNQAEQQPSLRSMKSSSTTGTGRGVSSTALFPTRSTSLIAASRVSSNLLGGVRSGRS